MGRGSELVEVKGELCRCIRMESWVNHGKTLAGFQTKTRQLFHVRSMEFWRKAHMSSQPGSKPREFLRALQLLLEEPFEEVEAIQTIPAEEKKGMTMNDVCHSGTSDCI